MIFTRDQLVRAFPNQPLLVAQMEEMGSLFDKAQETLAALQDALATVQGVVEAEGRWQPASPLLSSLADLEGQAGALVMAGGSDVVVQPIDTSDDASLLTKSRADTLYAPHP